ncbi:MAG: hypothetical protein KIT56_05800 [Gammaproteobacteria bacterium]|nr:hypothetical protein [Gammaproteobacteria bacterium]MCW5583382.1 hypothetical protein [Gammaproteobacteria bacterium]
MEANPDKAKIFHDAMERGTQPMIREIISHYDFSLCREIIDVGGEKGHLLCEILHQYPTAFGTVYDLPNAENSALEYIMNMNLSERCKVKTGSFFNSVPSGDMLLLKVILHDWDDKHAKLILKNCRKDMPDHGKLLIIEKVVEDNEFKDLACLGDINMMVTLSGKERSLPEFNELLNQSGFQLIRNINTSTVFSILEAEPI